jgi:hypothetical protein
MMIPFIIGSVVVVVWAIVITSFYTYFFGEIDDRQGFPHSRNRKARY